MADENKKTPGPSAGLSALGAAKKDKIQDRQTKLEKEQRLMRKENFYTGAEKSFNKKRRSIKKLILGLKKEKTKTKFQKKSFQKKIQTNMKKYLMKVELQTEKLVELQKPKADLLKRKKVEQLLEV